MIEVKINNAGLYGVFVGIMLREFRMGFWEKSSLHQTDKYLYDRNNVTFGNVAELPVTRYSFSTFCASIKKNNDEATMIKTLNVYLNADLIEKAYKTGGKGEADTLIRALVDHKGVEADWCEAVTTNGDMDKIRFKGIIEKYFGSVTKFLDSVPNLDPKAFRRIGTELDKCFKHVRTYAEIWKANKW